MGRGMSEVGLNALRALVVIAMNKPSLLVWDSFILLLHWCQVKGNVALVYPSQKEHRKTAAPNNERREAKQGSPR